MCCILLISGSLLNKIQKLFAVEVSALDAAVKTKKGKGASSAVASTSTATEVGNTSSANDDVEMQS